MMMKHALRMKQCQRMFQIQSRMFCDGGEKNLSPEILRKRRAQLEEKEARRLETERYVAEREAFEKKLNAMRKTFAQEHIKIEQQVKEKQKEAAERARVLAKEKVQAWKREYQKIMSQRTKLESTPRELANLTPEQLEKMKAQAKEDKIRRREDFLRRFRKQQSKAEMRYEVETEYLAKEAHGWLSNEDVENGELRGKIASKLRDIQPVTAAWQTALPKNHYPEAYKFNTQEMPTLDEFLSGLSGDGDSA